MNYITIGQKILLAREEKKMSQEQLANAIGCSQSALSNYEKGKRRIYLTQLEKLAEIFDKPLSYFVDGFEEEDNQQFPLLGPKDNGILRIINNIYTLSESEIKEVDIFIQFLRWRSERS